MINFYPGPSKLYPEVESFLNDAYHSGLLSMNHRSKPFMQMLAACISSLKQKLAIPDSYEVVFASSATECWEIVAQSLTGRNSYHVYNGAFGHKWNEYAQRIHGRAVGFSYPGGEQPQVEFAGDTREDLLCITHTETSNGTVVSDQALSWFRRTFQGLIAVDATSSMGGVALPWPDADVWYASVQKCFGLPPGLAVMVLSPGAVERASRIGERAYYNSLAFVIENFKKFQTPYTPNILAIYLLKRLMESRRPIDLIAGELEKRALSLYDFLGRNGFHPLFPVPECSSRTVIALKESPETVAAIKGFASGRGIVLGNGYGDWKETTFRIANFPAVSEWEIEELKRCLLEFKANQ